MHPSSLLPLSALCYFCYHHLSGALITFSFCPQTNQPSCFLASGGECNNPLLLQLLALIVSPETSCTHAQAGGMTVFSQDTWS